MRISAKYSHLNGEEYLMVRHDQLWNEVQDIITRIDTSTSRNEIKKEDTTTGRTPCSPDDVNQTFEQNLHERGWRERNDLLHSVYGQPADHQMRRIKDVGSDSIIPCYSGYFVKNRVAIEIQLGEYDITVQDLFIKHLGCYISDIIDVGIAVVPAARLQQEMSSGARHQERYVSIPQLGRGVPAVPLVLVGVEP